WRSVAQSARLSSSEPGDARLGQLVQRFVTSDRDNRHGIAWVNLPSADVLLSYDRTVAASRAWMLAPGPVLLRIDPTDTCGTASAPAAVARPQEHSRP